MDPNDIELSNLSKSFAYQKLAAQIDNCDDRDELRNIAMKVEIPGRTDIEPGKILYFIFPDASPKDNTDINLPTTDKYYTGFYLISAIRHKINLKTHMMTCELLKDSFAKHGEGTENAK